MKALEGNIGNMKMFDRKGWMQRESIVNIDPTNIISEECDLSEIYRRNCIKMCVQHFYSPVVWTNPPPAWLW